MKQSVRRAPLSGEVPRLASGTSSMIRLLLNHRSGRVGLSLAVALVVVIVVGPWVLGDPDATDYANKLVGPSSEHPLGTDEAGRDVLTRGIVAGQMSLGAAVAVFLLSTFIGLVVGCSAGLVGGRYDALISRMIDVFLGLPEIVIALAVVGALGPSFVNLIAAMSFSGWAYMARVARSYVLNASRRPDVIAARMAGVGSTKVAIGHVIPGVVAHVSIAGTMRLSETIQGLAGLSFLGLGAQPPSAEWGQMLASSRMSFSVAPWLFIAPTAGIMLSIGAAVLINDALRDVTDSHELGSR